MSDGGQSCGVSLGLEVVKSSQKWDARRSAVRSIAWLGLSRGMQGWGLKIIEPNVADIICDGNNELPTAVRCRKNQLTRVERFPVRGAKINALNPQFAVAGKDIRRVPPQG